MFRRLLFIVLLVLVCGAVSAQEFGKDLSFTAGTFWATEPNHDGDSRWTYKALAITAMKGKDCLYGEFEGSYQLFIYNRALGYGLQAVVRADDSLFRVGIQAQIADTGWSARVLTGSLPDRLDVYTKAVEICSEAESGFKFAIDGWLKVEQGCKPDPRVGFNFSWKGVNLSAWYNTRSEEVDSVFLTAPPLTTSF